MLGVEHYHANFWTRAFLQSEDATVAGIWDPDAERAKAFAGTYGIRAWDDADALVDAADAVAISSATDAHVDLVELAARHGRPVLCEKPLANTLEGCRRIAEIVSRSGIAFMQSFPKRFDPVNEEIRQILRDGTLGRVTLCRIRHGHSHGLNEEFRHAWFVDPARSGGGTLLDEGVHAADLLRMLFGEPETVSATISSATLGLPVEDTAAATFAYPDGLIAEVSTSWCFAGADASVEIYGTEGSIVLGGVDIASRPTRETDFLRIFAARRRRRRLDVLADGAQLQDGRLPRARRLGLRRGAEGRRPHAGDGRGRAEIVPDDRRGLPVGEERVPRDDILSGSRLRRGGHACGRGCRGRSRRSRRSSPVRWRPTPT